MYLDVLLLATMRVSSDVLWFTGKRINPSGRRRFNCWMQYHSFCPQESRLCWIRCGPINNKFCLP